MRGVDHPYGTGHMRLRAALEAVGVRVERKQDHLLVGGFLSVERLEGGNRRAQVGGGVALFCRSCQCASRFPRQRLSVRSP